jgi:ribonuclease T2
LSLRPSLISGLIGAALLASSALAGGKAGDFDFYVLALTWTPGYCATDDNPNRQQCAAKPRGFSVHGLWPEYEVGYPDYCPSSYSRDLRRSTLEAIDPVMPSDGLARYEWRKHGMCSGLDETAYFGTLLKAAKKVRIPNELGNVPRNFRASPDDIEAMFVAANPGLGKDGIAIQCQSGQLTEVRVCLTRDKLGFRRCLDVDDGGCRSRSILVSH